MTAKALYFPHIQMPNTAWTTQSLLYWDKVASIVPMKFMDEPEPLSDFMRGLLAEGLVEPILPGQHLYKVERFNECFIEFAEARLMPRQLHYQQDLAEGRVTRVHAEKLGQIPDCVFHAIPDTVPLRWRTAFRCDGGHRSRLKADSVPR